MLSDYVIDKLGEILFRIADTWGTQEICDGEYRLQYVLSWLNVLIIMQWLHIESTYVSAVCVAGHETLVETKIYLDPIST